MLLILALVSFFIASPKAALSEDNTEQVKAIFLYNLLNYISWPKSKISAVKNLCILGSNTFGDAFEYIKLKSKNRDLEISVSFITPSDNLDIETIKMCHMLYIAIPANAKNIIKTHKKHLIKNHILTVSDTKGFSQIGCVELQHQEDKISIIINRNKLKKYKLKANSRLLRVAKVVE
tara:strand:+ start:222665 stop:223195 length:531 start_codon:yes stop_codon:yes gene_type:complete